MQDNLKKMAYFPVPFFAWLCRYRDTPKYPMALMDLIINEPANMRLDTTPALETLLAGTVAVCIPGNVADNPADRRHPAYYDLRVDGKIVYLAIPGVSQSGWPHTH